MNQPCDVYVISLATPGGRTRLTRLRDHLDALGFDRVHVQPGIHGKYLTPDEVATHATTACQHMCTPSMIGCAASHAAVWRRVIASGAPYAIVLEDDTEMVPDAKDHVRWIASHMPSDTDMVVLGCFLCGTSPTPVPASQQSLRRIYQFSGTHAYLVTRRGARALLNHAYPVAFHLDMVISHLSRRDTVHVYAVTHDVASQTSGEATSENVTDRPPGFPGIAYTALKHVRDPKGQSLFFYAAMPVGRVGSYTRHTVITSMDIVPFILGLARVPIGVVASMVVLDATVTRRYVVSMAHAVVKAVVLYTLGRILRDVVF